MAVSRKNHTKHMYKLYGQKKVLTLNLAVYIQYIYVYIYIYI